jgi:heterokaryon incompatibility protein (HET)
MMAVSASLSSFDGSIPHYAILSHTWRADGEEVTYENITNNTGEKKAGYEKIRFCGRQAEHDGLQYFWIDTCCIDKSSSSELSEAINSMYRYYENAARCYAYLADVPDGTDIRTEDSAFRASRWFTRGWTLQELIAPSALEFYTANWARCGTKSSEAALIFEITGIPVKVLRDHVQNMRNTSVAQRMSWAANRRTTRVEDMAYCLLGIMEVHMGIQYGEAQHSFVRLQEEIIKNTTDHSLFAWTGPKTDSIISGGVLATSPADFADADNIQAHPESGTANYNMTNKGLCISLTICPPPRVVDEIDRSDEAMTQARGLHYAILRCHNMGRFQEIAIPVHSIGHYQYERLSGRYRPIEADKLHLVRAAKSRLIYLRKTGFSQGITATPQGMFLLPELPCPDFPWFIEAVYLPSCWSQSQRAIVNNPRFLSWSCAILMRRMPQVPGPQGYQLVLFLGFEFKPSSLVPYSWCKLHWPENSTEVKETDLRTIWQNMDMFNDKRHGIKELVGDDVLSVGLIHNDTSRSIVERRAGSSVKVKLKLQRLLLQCKL